MGINLCLRYSSSLPHTLQYLHYVDSYTNSTCDQHYCSINIIIATCNSKYCGIYQNSSNNPYHKNGNSSSNYLETKTEINSMESSSKNVSEAPIFTTHAVLVIRTYFSSMPTKAHFLCWWPTGQPNRKQWYHKWS